MKPLALAVLAVLLVTPVASADEPSARKAASAESSKSDDSISNSKRPIVERYEQILAEYVAEQARYRQAATKAETPRETRASADKRPRDLVAEYSRRMVDLAESSPERSGGPRRLALGDRQARQARLGGVWRPIRPRRGAARPPSR